MPNPKTFSRKLGGDAESTYGPCFAPPAGFGGLERLSPYRGHGPGSSCGHLPCGAFREKREFKAFFTVKCFTENPVAETHLIGTLATCLDARMKACLFAVLPGGGGYLYSYELLVEYTRDVDPLHAWYIARKLESGLCLPAGAPGVGCVVELLPPCGWQVVNHLAVWASRVKKGDLVGGNWNLYPRLVDMVESVGLEAGPFIQKTVLLCRLRCDGSDTTTTGNTSMQS